MLADVGRDKLTVVTAAVGEDILDKVVAKLVSSNCLQVNERSTQGRLGLGLTINQWHAGTIGAALTDPLQVAVQELATANLEALLDDLGSILINAVVGGEAKNVVDGSGTISRGAVLANVLDAPIAKLAMGNDVDAREDLVDTGALQRWS